MRRSEMVWRLKTIEAQHAPAARSEMIRRRAAHGAESGDNHFVIVWHFCGRLSRNKAVGTEGNRENEGDTTTDTTLIYLCSLLLRSHVHLRCRPHSHKSKTRRRVIPDGSQPRTHSPPCRSFDAHTLRFPKRFAIRVCPYKFWWLAFAERTESEARARL